MSFGYPKLLNRIGQIQSKILLLVADAMIIANMFQGPRWGIWYQSTHKPVLKPDTISGVEVRREWSICNYPTESGGFQSYNKVRQPIMVRIRMSKGGTERDRAAFLAAVDDMAASTDLYDIVTPEGTWEGVNCTHYDYRQTTHSGVGLLTIDMMLQEVRQAQGITGLTAPLVPCKGDPFDLGIKFPSLSEIKSGLLSLVT